MAGEGIAGIFTTETGALHPLVWVLAIMIAVFSILFVWIVFHFLIPMKNSPARHFVKARRDRKPVFFLDAGKFFRCVVSDHKVGEEMAQVFRQGQDIIKGGEGMKYCEGVLMGVGEDFRALTVNVGVIDLMEMIETKDWDPKDVDEKLKKLEEELKKDLGLKDELKDLKLQYVKDLAEANALFDAKRDEIIEKHSVVQETPEEEGSDD